MASGDGCPAERAHAHTHTRTLTFRRHCGADRGHERFFVRDAAEEGRESGRPASVGGSTFLAERPRGEREPPTARGTESR